MGLDPALWHEFFATTASASAALLGLFIVAISLHLRLVEGHAIVRNQARVSMLLLALTLAISATGQVPGVTGRWLGVEVLLALVLQLAVYSGGLVQATRSQIGIPRAVWARLLPVVALVALTAAGAVSLIAQKGLGLYLLVPWLVGVPLAAVYMAWIVLLQSERVAVSPGSQAVQIGRAPDGDEARAPRRGRRLSRS